MKHISIILALLTFLFELTAINCSHWSSRKDTLSPMNKMYTHMGLWKFCVEDCSKGSSGKVDVDLCIEIPPKGALSSSWPEFPSDALKRVQGFALTGYILTLIGLGMCLFSKHMTNYKAICVLMILGGIFSILSVILYGAQLLKLSKGGKDMTLDPCYGFYMNLFGGIFSVLFGLHVCHKFGGMGMSMY